MSRVLSFHYTLTNPAGDILDSSRNAQPFQVLEGKLQIIPNLEDALFKMSVGQKGKVSIAAPQAYGTVREELKLKVPREKLPAGDVRVGTQFSTGPETQGPIFVVTKIEGNDVYLDGNHPLAGIDLTFDVEVMDIREATAEELSHGHAHGPDGHHHH